MTAEALLEEIKTHYDLDEYVSDWLVIGYYSHTRQGVKAWKALHPMDIVKELGMRTNEDGVQVEIKLQDLEVFVQQEAGDKVEEDISCDSDFMLRKIPEIGAALRSAYHWLRRDETIYLIMDNAGGHGSNDAMAQYTGVLWNEYKVQLVWQIPRSPETNMLDLGIWMSIQAVVTRVHHRRGSHPDALARSVEDAWGNYLSPSAFQNVHERLKIVLHCIVDDNGGNSLVERKRGKLFRDCTILENDDDDNNNDLEPSNDDDFDDNDNNSTS
jgi:hypothetical protein